MMHGDEGIGVDGPKELDPGPSKHDDIHVGDIMEQTWSHIHYELVTLLPDVTSNHIISAFINVKTTNGNTYVDTYLFCQSLGGGTI
jgi:hypothetical protein